MVRYGIIGVGAMGREHAENLSFIEGATVTAISDPDAGSRELAQSQIKSPVAVFSDHNELLNSRLVDAVIIATPNYTHVDILKDVFLDVHQVLKYELITNIVAGFLQTK